MIGDKEVIQNPYSVVVLSAQLLADLLDMARKSTQYREGYAWTASAMHEANRLLNNERIRQGQSS